MKYQLGDDPYKHAKLSFGVWYTPGARKLVLLGWILLSRGAWSPGADRWPKSEQNVARGIYNDLSKSESPLKGPWTRLFTLFVITS